MWKAKSEHNNRNEWGEKRCRWDSENSRRCKTKWKLRIRMFVCVLHGSSRANKWFAHTHLQSLPPHSRLKELNTAPRCEPGVLPRPVCDSVVSRKTHSRRPHARPAGAHATAGWHPETFNRHNAGEEATCVNTGHKRVDLGYTVDLCYSRSRNWGFSGVWSQGTKETKPSGVNAVSLMYEWCGYSSGSGSHYFTLNNCDWHNWTYRSSDGCYGYIILFKLRQPKRVKDKTAKAPPQLREISALNVLSDNISSRDRDWCRMRIHVLLRIQPAIPP